MMTRPIAPADIVAFLPHMENRAELEGLFGLPAADVIGARVALSDWTFVGVRDDVPLFLGGVWHEGQAGRVWMLAQPGVERARKFYLRATREAADYMLTLFPRLWCPVATDYPKSIRWLRWLGFTISAPQVADGREFIIAEKVA